MPATCCERCHAAPDDYDDKASAQIRLGEVQTNYGILTFLCFDCRREWQRVINSSPVMREYSETAFRLEHWRVYHPRTGQGDVEAGVQFVRKLNELDEKLYNETVSWIKDGPSRAERAHREAINPVDQDE